MTIAIELLVLCAFLLGFVCIGLGYWWASANHRRTAGGKSVKELAEEKEAYQDQVVEHFKTTAELLNEMTDKYRDVYRHMAEGAQNLASTESAGPALAALQHGLLAAPAADAEAVIDSEAKTVANNGENQNAVANTADSLAADAQSKLENEAQPVQDNTEERQDETPESVSVEQGQETKEFFSNAENEQHEQIPPENAEEGDEGKDTGKN